MVASAFYLDGRPDLAIAHTNGGISIPPAKGRGPRFNGLQGALSAPRSGLAPLQQAGARTCERIFTVVGTDAERIAQSSGTLGHHLFFEDGHGAILRGG